MRIRTVALALALACGLTAPIEAKTKTPKFKGTYKAQKYKAPKYKASKNKTPKVKRHA